MSEVKIIVDPKEALVDERVHIEVEGLPQNKPITIKASFQEEGQRFCSYGCFTSTDGGHVMVERQAAVQGTYTGVEPMGLFWSMKPEPSQRQQIRFLKRNVTTPIIVTFAVLEGHLCWVELFDPPTKPLAISKVYRWYKHKSVRREIVREGNIRGVLFTPSGPGPFPGVIDLFGSGGSLFEHRGALLASRGFCVLSLAFYAYEDLPKFLTDVTLDYFIESAGWFSRLPIVMSSGVGIISLSKSGEYALEMVRQSSKVKAIVLVNAVPFCSHVPLKYSKGDIQCTEYLSNEVKFTPNGMDTTGCLKPSDDIYSKVWTTRASVLCIVGEDDHILNPKLSERFMELVPKEHKHRFQMIKYPGAGHLIEPPHVPHCRSSHHNVFDEYLFWGGETKSHSYAQEDSWWQILQFFSTQLKSESDNQYSSKL
ncbi:acyl-coenzyme A amino acid N-acyltransferase 1-like [Saccostrea echinata]|uniref:acyl-coenzyme A amino acid N-acyltransferase 1-like n=1 Tax=Saccostrea echinata TaxID=191078 RepID=UPI002A80D698|nr:acyl-coenzyme A amino acid N-acyltransferase 1-like [Saccostrea echinata]